MTSQAVSAQLTKVYISASISGSNASPIVYTHIKEIRNFSREGDRSEIDVSSLDSLAKEYRLGLQDYGNLSFECLAVFDDPGQQKVVAALSSPDPYDFKIEYPDGSFDLFSALVKQFNLSGGVDDVLVRTGSLRLTGVVTSIVG